MEKNSFIFFSPTTVQKTGGTVVEAVSATFSCQGTIEAKVIKQKNKEEEEKLK